MTSFASPDGGEGAAKKGNDEGDDGEKEKEKVGPADRIRLVHAYVTATEREGGLGVAPEAGEWDRVESVMALHDRTFNEKWIRAWTTRQLGLNVQIDRIKDQVRVPSLPIYALVAATY